MLLMLVELDRQAFDVAAGWDILRPPTPSFATDGLARIAAAAEPAIKLAQATEPNPKESLKISAQTIHANSCVTQAVSSLPPNWIGQPSGRARWRGNATTATIRSS
jgi:hypothetical protein